MNLKTILVPLDGSIVAEAALAPAVDLAREAGAKLVLMRAAEYLAAARTRVMAAGVVEVEAAAWYGPPVEAIVEAARHRGADLIVMSSHGRSGVARLVMGSVAEGVLRSTRVPILLIRPDGAPIDTPSMGVPSAKEVSRA